MELGRHRTPMVFGADKIWKCIYDLAEANGLSVRVVDIWQNQLNHLYNGPVRFISKEVAIAISDIIVNVMNLTKNLVSLFYNVGYFSVEYLSKNSKRSIQEEPYVRTFFRAGAVRILRPFWVATQFLARRN